MPPSLHDALEDALTYLPSALDEDFAGHPLGGVLVNEATAAIREVVSDPGYKIQGSRGRGNWAGTVWVAVFDRLVTDTAQRGFFLVYLFRGDGQGVYLSLNQGTTEVHDEVGGRRYLGFLRDRATVYAGLVKSVGLDGLALGPIDLSGSGTLTNGYQAGNVASRFYDANSIPGDDVLHEDLRRFLALYRRLIEANDHLADADTPVQGDGTSSGLEARRLRWHLRAERNPKLAADAKREHGSICAVCGFDFGIRYGPLGEGYIEAHHLTPFADLDGRPTELNAKHDFAVLCSNCHRMVHHKRPPYTLDEVQAALQ